MLLKVVAVAERKARAHGGMIAGPVVERLACVDPTGVDGELLVHEHVIDAGRAKSFLPAVERAAIGLVGSRFESQTSAGGMVARIVP